MDAAGIHLSAMYRQMIDSARSVDPLLPVIVQAPSYSNPEYFSLIEKQSDPFCIYEFHAYRPTEYVNAKKENSAGAYPGSFISIIEGKFSVYHDRKYLADSVFKHVNAFAKESGAPIFLGEFGMLLPQKGGPQLFTDISDIAIENGWHFAYWDYRRPYPGWDVERLGVDYVQAVVSSFHKNRVPSAVPCYRAARFSMNIAYSGSPDQLIANISLPNDAEVSLTVVDVMGREVSGIAAPVRLAAGDHALTIPCNGLAAGAYFVVATVGEERVSQLLVR